jgi:hypothetical protein
MARLLLVTGIIAAPAAKINSVCNNLLLNFPVTARVVPHPFWAITSGLAK